MSARGAKCARRFDSSINVMKSRMACACSRKRSTAGPMLRQKENSCLSCEIRRSLPGLSSTLVWRKSTIEDWLRHQIIE